MKKIYQVQRTIIILLVRMEVDVLLSPEQTQRVVIDEALLPPCGRQNSPWGGGAACVRAFGSGKAKKKRDLKLNQNRN